jgi:hypothetical protein
MNTDWICIECCQDEQLCPGYDAARKAEDEAIRTGNYNLPSVGLSPDDQAFLQARLAERHKACLTELPTPPLRASRTPRIVVGHTTETSAPLTVKPDRDVERVTREQLIETLEVLHEVVEGGRS